MALNDLCTLAEAKTWLNQTADTSDTILAQLISRYSGFILNKLQRPPLRKTAFLEVYDGQGGASLTLRQWPVLSIAAVTVDGRTITASPDGVSNGFFLSPWDGTPPGRLQQVILRGDRFWRGQQNVTVHYSAGYVVQAEPQTIAAGAVTASAPHGPWCWDEGVTYDDGTPLTKVAGAPDQGQYQLNPTTPGAYVFNSADNGRAILISYDFVPLALNQACAELVAERQKYRDRIGQKSKSLGGNETVAFDNSGTTSLILDQLQPFKRVVPV